MKFHPSLLLFLAASALFSCQNDSQTEITKPGDRPKPKVDTLKMPEVGMEGAAAFDIYEGQLTWTGKEDGQLYGATARVNGGELSANKGYLLQGKINFDLGSFAITSGLAEEANRKTLENKIKGATFLNVAKYPTATFVFKEVLPSNIAAFNTVLEGDLTLRDKSVVLNIPAKVTVTNAECTLESVSFGINAANWGMKMPGEKGGKTGDTPGQLSADNISLTLSLKAKPR